MFKDVWHEIMMGSMVGFSLYLFINVARLLAFFGTFAFPFCSHYLLKMGNSPPKI